MGKKMGRPPLPKGQARGVQVGVRFKREDDKTIEKVTAGSGQTKADWVRNAALAEARRPVTWVRSKWKLEELDGKLVEFKLTAPKLWVEGLGKFLVRKNLRGELSIEICVLKSPNPNEIVETRYWLGQQAADKIELNPNPKLAEFRLLG